MSKPLGIAIALDPASGSIRMGVTRSEEWMDKIWDAVEDARARGVDFQRFRRQVIEAWTERVQDEAKWEREEAMKWW